MLILSRKIGEEIIIGNKDNPEYVKIAVTKMIGGRVYLGFEAANDVRIDRKEIFESKQKNG